MVTWCFLFLQEKYPKYIHNIFVLFFLQKILQKWFFFSVKDKLSKNATYYFTYTTHKSKITSFVYFFFIIFFFRQQSFFTNLLPLSVSRVFVCRWMKIVVVVVVLNLFKLVQTCSNLFAALIDFTKNALQNTVNTRGG